MEGRAAERGVERAREAEEPEAEVEDGRDGERGRRRWEATSRRLMKASLSSVEPSVEGRVEGIGREGGEEGGGEGLAGEGVSLVRMSTASLPKGSSMDRCHSCEWTTASSLIGPEVGGAGEAQRWTAAAATDSR